MKKIYLSIFLMSCFVSPVLSEDSTTDETIVICEEGYYYNGDENEIKSENCIKCPGSGTVEESTCSGSTCSLQTKDKCNILKNRKDKTGSFYYKSQKPCVYNDTKPSTGTNPSTLYSDFLNYNTNITNNAEILRQTSSTLTPLQEAASAIKIK
ncbi:MAG: hypothetical protein IKN73_03910 [Alphaproteobacteria bacterium]|nr:hypothetical protein [Alphaproteobacteria bacterium]